MMTEEGRSRKQHLISALSHVSRWERNKPEAQQISSESLHSSKSPSSLKGAFFSFYSQQNKKTTPSSSRFQQKHHNPLSPITPSLNRFTSSPFFHPHKKSTLC